MSVKLGDTKPFTSSYTVTNACVEVGSSTPASVEIGDSKFNHSDVGRAAKFTVALSPQAFSAFASYAASQSV